MRKDDLRQQGDEQKSEENICVKINLMTLPREIRDLILSYAYATKFSTTITASTNGTEFVHTPLTCYGYEHKVKEEAWFQAVNLIPSIRLWTISVSKQFLIESLMACHHFTSMGMVTTELLFPGASPAGTTPFLEGALNIIMGQLRYIWIPVYFKARFTDTLRDQMPKLAQVTIVNDRPDHWYDSVTTGARPGYFNFCDQALFFRCRQGRGRETTKLLTQMDVFNIVERKQLCDSLQPHIESHMRRSCIKELYHKHTCTGLQFVDETCSCDQTRRRHSEVRFRYQLTVDCDVEDIEPASDDSRKLTRKAILLTLVADVDEKKLVGAQARFGLEHEP